MSPVKSSKPKGKRLLIAKRSPIPLFILMGIDAFFVMGLSGSAPVSLMIENFFQSLIRAFWSPGDGVGKANGMIRKYSWRRGFRGLSADHAVVQSLTFI